MIVQNFMKIMFFTINKGLNFIKFCNFQSFVKKNYNCINFHKIFDDH